MYNVQLIACSKVITGHNLISRQPMSVYNPHRGIINSVNINHSNKVVASCGQDGKLIMMSMGPQGPKCVVFDQSFNAQQQKQRPTSINCCMFSSNSKFIAAGSVDSLVKIWDMKGSKKVFCSIKSHIGSITSLGWIKTNNEEILVSSSMGDIFLHGVPTGTVLDTLKVKAHESVNAIRVSKNNNILASCTNTGSIMAWDINGTSPSILCGFSNPKKSSFTSMCISSTNSALIAASSIDENITFYDMFTQKQVKVINTEEPLTAINFHNDGYTLAAGGMYGGLFLYDLRKTDKSKEKLIGHQTTIKSLDFIKQHEKSNIIADSRQNKAHYESFNNMSTTNSTHNKKQQNNHDNKNLPKQGLKSYQVKQNNYIKLQSQNLIKPQPIVQIQNKSIASKLSPTGEEVIRNSQQVGGVNFKKNDKNPIKGILSANNIPELQTKSTWQQPNETQNTQYRNEEINNIYHKLKSDMNDQFQGLHMQMIRQFQIQQSQLKVILQHNNIELKKKDQYILKLEQENKKLKNNTY